MNKCALIFLTLCLVPLTIWALDIYHDRQLKVLIKAPTYLYSNEEDAAYVNSLTQPLLELTPSDELIVKRTTFGKDYWALQVETIDGASGWIISGQQGVHIIEP